MKKKRGAPKYKQGYYRPIFPDKYIGDIENIYYRSGLELKFMRFFDLNSAILKWNSEDVIVKYLDETTNKIRRYFVDFYIKLVDINKQVKEYLVEIKPYQQVNPKRFKNDYSKLQYIKNVSKWKAAERYAKSVGVEFLILTERDL